MILPSHTSNTTQPLDCDPNGVLKAQFCKECAIRVNYKLGDDDEKQRTAKTSSQDEIPSSSALKSAGSECVPDTLSSIIFPDNGPFVGTSVAHRNFLSDVLPLAIEAATLTRCIENGWRKSGLAPFNPDVALAGLPDGYVIPDPKNYPPISGRIITDPEMRICIYTWKLNQAERKLSRLNPTSTDYVETKEEIKLLTSLIESIKLKTMGTTAGESDRDSQSPSSTDDQKHSVEENRENETEQKGDANLMKDKDDARDTKLELTEEEIEQFVKPRKRTLAEIEQSICPKKEQKRKKHPLQKTREPSTRNRTLKIPEYAISWDDFEALEDWPESK